MFIVTHCPTDVAKIKEIAKGAADPVSCEEHLLFINRRAWELIQAREEEDKRHRKACDDIAAAVSALYKDCPHPDKGSEYWSFAYDSGYECMVCGCNNMRPGRKPLV
jgi:hypothetical protein